MRCFLAAFAAVMFVVSGFGQTFGCPTMASRAACKSFQQMRVVKDPDIVEALASETSFVCFSPKKDRFLTVAFETPAWSAWHPDMDSQGNPYVKDWATGVDVQLHAYGSAQIQFFEDGVSDQTLSFDDHTHHKPWSAMHAHYVSGKPVISASDLYFGGDCGAGMLCSLTVDQSEIRMIENISGSHSVSIRRSTKRFFETIGDETVTGQCAEFTKAKSPRVKSR